MSSIAFPAFGQGQLQHEQMRLDHTAEQLYHSVEQAVHAPTHAASAAAGHAPIAASLDNRPESATQLVPGNASTASTAAAPTKKITKRVNARLQLAAALIEADNDRILEKAQFWHIYHPPQANDLVHPPPPPQPALASQSAIFAPFREGASIAVKRHVRTWSAATGLSRLLDAGDDGKRPSIDFLGVALPNEQRARSRAGSSVGALAESETPRNRSDSLFSNAAPSVLGRTSKVGSRPASLLAQSEHDELVAADAASDDDALSAWGVEKFLSKVERERIAAGSRSRAQSLAGSITGARSSFEQLAPSLTARPSVDVDPSLPAWPPAVRRASSEVAAATSAGAAAAHPKLELLAKIKLYRERQENLPPAEWQGPGPAATKDEVIEHIIASAEDSSRTSLRQASHELDQASAVARADATETASVMDRPRPSSRAGSASSTGFLTAALPADPARSTGHASTYEDSRAAPLSHSADPSSTEPQTIPVSETAVQADPISFNQSAPGEAQNMVGVGSYSRSNSRRNSFLEGPLLESQAEASADHNTLAPEESIVPSQSFLPVAPTQVLAAQPRRLSRGWATDQFAEHEMGLGPSPFGAALQAASPALDQTDRVEAGPTHATSSALDFNSLSTRQLQNVARNSTFPSYLGINRDLLAEEAFDEPDDPLLLNEFGIAPKRRRRSSADITALAKDLAQTGGDNFEIQLGDGTAPDLSSANWGKPRKKWFRLSMMMDAKGKPIKSKKTVTADGAEGDGESDAEALDVATVQVDQLHVSHQPIGDAFEAPTMMAGEASPAAAAEHDEIDDDYISPPRRGPLRPLGLAARTPQTIVMPSPLQGTDFAPKLRLTEAMPSPVATQRHSLHVPDGFVLHNRGGLPPMRSLVVHSANGPQPLFAAKTKNKKSEPAAARLKAVEVDRTVQVPAAAPRGIGRRAAAPTTALFRNHLVQHDDEREGWGFESGTRVDDIFSPGRADDSDDDDRPLADIKQQSRSAKRAAKRLAKERRKRKAARRVRRAKREEALKEGKSFKEVGVDELSPDEDLDLSSTTSEEDATDTGSESDLWASDDDKRWVDENKPAGKLYGKSLLDLASERNKERKSKARFYGQVQLEDGEAMPLQFDDERDAIASLRPGASVYDDGASIAPSVARSFRDKPVGVNDTRERMEAVFGSDHVWAREMAKRQQQDALEAEQAKEKALLEEAVRVRNETEARARKERGLFTLGRKSKKNLGMSNSSAVNSAVSLAGSNGRAPSITPSGAPLAEETVEREDEPVRSHTPVEPPVIALDLGDVVDADGDEQGGRKSLNLLAGEEAATQEWMIDSDVEQQTETKAQDSSDDDVPLAQVKKNVASRPNSLAAGLSLHSNRMSGADSSEEELPLAALKEKRIRQSMLLGGGKLDLDFAASRDSSLRNGSSEVPSPSVGSPRPGSMREPNGISRDGYDPSQLAGVRGVSHVEDDDSDEDLPLGHRHPGGDAALAAMRTALDNQKRAVKEARLAEKAQRKAARLAQQVQANNEHAEEAGEQSRGVDHADEAEEDSDEDDSEDDKPLGYVHPQAAIIAEQAALIRQLQLEREQQDQQQQQQRVASPYSGMMSPSGMDMRSSMMLNRMSGLPSFMNGMSAMSSMGMADPRQPMMGFPTNGSTMMGMSQFDGLPASSAGLPLGMSMLPPSQMAAPGPPGSQIGMSAGMSPAMTMPTLPGTPQMGAPMTANSMAMMLDPKASSIHNWRTQVPPDATAILTPPGGASTVNSAG
ncbi:hypothetical protein PHSY_005689 [Pseudozyma hubeiensis SY62]|uniref:Uncharacterized protein n=1 Tax=Pseudozyma hubeiensis (strain SY62) TaxID=1305764 RepID=R9PIZ5_PSEHS|nr:hypothetical protein PHSY_005689 [Pseudozyma hubeiensis SY62]GAC98100.1 hypothetical protein PHSY_005689 [Pseudozyma hubeiensis SY62]